MTWAETRVLILWTHVFRFKQFHVFQLICHRAFFFDWTFQNCRRDPAQNQRIWQPLNCRYPFSSLADSVLRCCLRKEPIGGCSRHCYQQGCASAGKHYIHWKFCCQRVTNQILFRSWFQILFMFTPAWQDDPIWRSYFSNGLKLPTSC